MSHPSHRRTEKNSPPYEGGEVRLNKPRRGGHQAKTINPLESSQGNRHIHNLPVFKTFRRQLRSNLTPAEAKLWSLIKAKQLQGRRFRRQFSISEYILDFYCPTERLAVELDGEVHNSDVAAQRDFERDLFLEKFGVKVLRFENHIVFESSDWLLEQIKIQFGWRDHPPPPAT